MLKILKISMKVVLQPVPKTLSDVLFCVGFGNVHCELGTD